MKTKEFQIDAADNEILANLLGVFDKNLRVIEKALSIEIKNRGNIFLLSGSTKDLIRGEKSSKIYTLPLPMKIYQRRKYIY